MMTEPLTLDEIAGQTAFVTEAKRWQEKGEYPAAVLVYGPPGVGKTTVGKVLARASLGDFFDPMNFIMTNASDDRGIDFIRNNLKQWALTAVSSCLTRLTASPLQRKMLCVKSLSCHRTTASSFSRRTTSARFVPPFKAAAALSSSHPSAWRMVLNASSN